MPDMHPQTIEKCGSDPAKVDLLSTQLFHRFCGSRSEAEQFYLGRGVLW
jgi:hypothetical protein